MGSKTASASQAVVVVKTQQSPNGFVLGICENFSASNNYASETINAIGHEVPVDNVVHGISGATVSWGRAITRAVDDLVSRGVAPSSLSVNAFDPITVIFIDKRTEEALCEVVDAVPASIGINASSMSTIRENFSGSARFIRWGSEVAA